MQIFNKEWILLIKYRIKYQISISQFYLFGATTTFHFPSFYVFIKLI